jgi:hypothetical protein
MGKLILLFIAGFFLIKLFSCDIHKKDIKQEGEYKKNIAKYERRWS